MDGPVVRQALPALYPYHMIPEVRNGFSITCSGALSVFVPEH